MPPRTVEVHLRPAEKGTPDEVVDAFGTALRAGDAVAATAFFSRHGCFVTPDSTVIRGRSDIRGFLRQFVDTAGELTIEQRTMVTAGDVAIGSENWTLSFGGRGGTVRRTSRSTIVLARIEDTWRIAVIDPWREQSPAPARVSQTEIDPTVPPSRALAPEPGQPR